MSRKQYSPQFKAKLFLEILQGEKELGTIAYEHDVNHNMLRNWSLDLLFYHRNLRCLVAIDLKVGKFKPEYVSKMASISRVWIDKSKRTMKNHLSGYCFVPPKIMRVWNMR